MSDRHQIIADEEFWTRLEYDATRWLESSDDRTLRRIWIDGLLPESIADTKRGADIAGVAWVGVGGSEQFQYRFVVSVPQKVLYWRETYSIEQLSLDEAQQTLQIELTSEKPVA